MENKTLDIWGAREHNLKDLDLHLPHESLIVLTGLSGSGKSSLAFDTIYAEGQRRYMETFSAYARQFIGHLERPNVDKIDGLSPVIAIEQKTTNKNPRSTVGTITEIYDFLRLLYARIGEAYSYVTGEKMVKYTEDQILQLLTEKYAGHDILILSPLVNGRKGHYRELFESVRKQGFLKVRVDGELTDLTFGMHLDRYKVHDIELVIDRVTPSEKTEKRLKTSVRTALKQGKGSLMVYDPKDRSAVHYSKNLMCPTSGISYPEPEPNTFSFNSPYGACPHCKGLGIEWQPDPDRLIPDPAKSLKQGAIRLISDNEDASWKSEHLGMDWIKSELRLIVKQFKLNEDQSLASWPQEAVDTLIYGSPAWRARLAETENETGVPGAATPPDEAAAKTKSKSDAEIKGLFWYIAQLAQNGNIPTLQRWAEQFMTKKTCRHCGGTRLHPMALHYRIDGRNIAELAAMSLEELAEWTGHIESKLAPWQQQIGHEILREINHRIRFLLDVGIGYLSLNRESTGLSGGESQRIRLATQIGSHLVNVLYILDEPSIGLHQRDNLKLIHSLQKLRDMGNTVLVVEHDEEMMRAADYIVDIGPGAGVKGGKIMAQGRLEEFLKQDSLTADYLNGKRQIEIPVQRRPGSGAFLELTDAVGHNLKHVHFRLPLQTFTCVTGVSGSGKSSLVSQTLLPVLSRHFYRSSVQPLPYGEILGLEHIDKVIEVDQSPIGRTPRSNPATYVGVFEDIRKLFASLPEAKIRGYKAGRFSFNIRGGRCERCGGAGVETIEMNFLPDVYVTCEECHGKRYNRETLEIRYKGKSINDVLNMSIAQAVEFFENIPHILTRIKALDEVGLGYVALGQPSTTLSGGEAQRIKLAAELARKSTGKTLYILDEPTTGLHFEDIRALLQVLQRLVDQGNTVLVVEHNLDVIKCADHIIDIGPEGGRNGGQIVAEGRPEEIAKIKKSYTGRYLAPLLKI